MTLGGRPLLRSGPTALGTTAAAATTITPTPRIEPRAPLVGVAAPLFRGRLDLRQVEIVLRPLDRNLLADELLDGLEIQRARFVDERVGHAGRAGTRGAADAVVVILGVLRQVPVD